MKRFLSGIIIICALFLHEGVYSQHQSVRSSIEKDSYGFNILVNGSHIIIQNATPKSNVVIFSILGVKLKEYKAPATGDDLQFDLPKGCYILKTENIVRKIAIK